MNVWMKLAITRILGFAALLTLAPFPGTVPHAASSAGVERPLSFHIREGNNDNYFLSAQSVACHLIVTGEANPRLLVNFPAGNSGIALWFDKNNPSNRALSLKLSGALSPLEDSTNGVRFRIDTGRKKVVITNFMLDSIRQVRNAGTMAQKEVETVHKALSRSPVTLLPSVSIHSRGGEEALVIERAVLKGGKYRVEILPGPGVQILKENNGALTLEGPCPVSFTVRCATPFTPLAPYDSEELFSPQALTFRDELKAHAAAPGAGEAAREKYERFNEALRNLRFLSFREKYCAGSWRFLTYFGRDTLISLMMLRPVLTPGAYCDGLASVLDRLSPHGSVAHEEDIGSWAEYRHGAETLKGKGMPTDPEMPIYDHKMVDDDFLLPVMAWSYLGDEAVAVEAKRAFLQRRGAQGEKNIVTLLRNGECILRSSSPFAMSLCTALSGSFETLVRIGMDEKVGNWRDSEEGLGRGIYPGDVNIELVPLGLSALDAFLRSKICGREELVQAAAAANLPLMSSVLKGEKGRNPGEMARVWGAARRLFVVSLTADEVRSRLGAYMEGGLSGDERRFFMDMPVEGSITVRDFVHGRRVPPSLAGGLRFYALSLNADGTPVEVENSDLAFSLFMALPSPEELSMLLPLLELPYPLGLYTDVGILVANPALSRDRVHWRTLGRKAYHGTVIWSWQVYMIELGLVRQIERFVKSGEHPDLVARMKKVQKRIIGARERAGALANSELWSFAVENGALKPAAFGAEEGADDESNAVQLWSTVFPAVIMEEKRMEGR